MAMMHGDGQPPPINRPPQTNMELRRLIDALATEPFFTRWLARQQRPATGAGKDKEG